MVSDTIPQLKKLSLARKQKLVAELAEEVYGEEVPRGPLANALKMRLNHFRHNPSSARSWARVRARLRRKK